jgi:hypothetical protein
MLCVAFWRRAAADWLLLAGHSALIGEVDTDKDATIDFGAIKAEPLPQIHF